MKNIKFGCFGIFLLVLTASLASALSSGIENSQSADTIKQQLPTVDSRIKITKNQISILKYSVNLIKDKNHKLIVNSIINKLEGKNVLNSEDLKDILIDERDKYLTHKIRTAPGKKIVAVIGAGHVPGIQRYWNTEIDLETLEHIPPKTKTSTIIKWMIPLFILVLFVLGFFHGGANTGTDMIAYWVLANGILAGFGAIIALAHPLTILSSVLAAPLTSLNPMIAAGWVSGLVEAFSRKPKVKDFERLPEDIISVRGFWKNKITRILLVVVFTNIGSSLGTFVAIPLMVKVL